MGKTVVFYKRAHKIPPIFDWIFLAMTAGLFAWNVVTLLTHPPNGINDFPGNTALSAAILVSAIGNFAENLRWRVLWLGISMLFLALTFWVSAP